MTVNWRRVPPGQDGHWYTGQSASEDGTGRLAERSVILHISGILHSQRLRITEAGPTNNPNLEDNRHIVRIMLFRYMVLREYGA